MLIPLLLIASVAMGSIGSLIGLMAPDEGLAGLFGNLVMMGVLFLGMVPVNTVGQWSLAFWILPSTGPLAILKGINVSRALQHLAALVGTRSIRGRRHDVERIRD